jgi:hypothetical protein
MINLIFTHARQICRIALALNLLVLPALGQDIFESATGMYSTSDLIINAKVESQRKVLIRATPSLVGHLSIETSTEPAIKVVYNKIAKTESKSRAFDYIDLMSVSLDRFPDQVRLDLRAPNPPPWNADTEAGTIDVRMVLPQGWEVEIEAMYFDVIATGPFSKMLVRSSLGRLTISDVTRQLVLGTANQRVSVEKIAGDISVTTTNASLVGREITAVRQAARFRNDGGDIQLEGVTGQVNVRNSYGRIDISDFTVSGEGNFIRGASGPISLELTQMTDGQLVVNNRYEDIEIRMPDNISAYFSLAVDEGGSIYASNFRFLPDLIKPTRLAFTAGTGKVGISSSVRGKGNILITGVESDAE